MVSAVLDADEPHAFCASWRPPPDDAGQATAKSQVPGPPLEAVGSPERTFSYTNRLGI